ncbi:unnamed protein product, partial [Brassica oleracea]
MVPSTHKKDTPVTTSGIDAHHTSGATLRSLTGTPHATHSQGSSNRDSTPPTSSAPLYRLNHSFGLVGGTGEPRELVRCVGQRARKVHHHIIACKGSSLDSQIGPTRNSLLTLCSIARPPGQPGRKGKTERQSPEGYVRYTGPSQSAHKEERKGAATAQQIIVGFGDTTIRKKAALPRNNRSIEKAARNTDTTKEREADKGRIPTTINQ